MKVVLDKGAFEPIRAHETDAGLDIRAMKGAVVPCYASYVFSTGVHIQLPKGTAGLLVSKSGLNVKHGIISTGLIDEGYTGEIKVALHNLSDTDFHISAGDKISQLVVIPVQYEPVEIVDNLDKSERGNDGFGSTGK